MSSRWWTVAGCFVGMSMAFSAALLACFGLYLKPMTAEFGWDRTQISFGVSLISLVAVIATPFAGALIDRYGSKNAL